MQQKQVVQAKSYNLFYGKVRHHYQVQHTEYQYTRKQVLSMGGEMALVRSNSYVPPSPRTGRGGGATKWRDRSFNQGSVPLPNTPGQSDMEGSQYYNQVPDLIKKNSWNTKTKRSGGRTYRCHRHMNSGGDYFYNESGAKSDYQKNAEEFAAGFPITMGTREYGKKGITGHNKSNEGPSRALATTPQDPQVQPKQQQRKPHGKSNADKNEVTATEVVHYGKNNAGRRRNNVSHRGHYLAPTGAHRAIRGRSHNSSADMSSLTFEQPVFTRLQQQDGTDRFLYLGSHKEVKYFPKPDNLFTGGQWDKLSDGIWKNFVVHQQSDMTYCKKVQLWKCMLGAVKHEFPQYNLFLVGSTMTGFGCDISDVDLCLLVRQTHMDQRSEAVVHLERLLGLLKDCDFVMDPVIIQARVPILRFQDCSRVFEVDLNCNNAVGIRNTHLQYCYSQLDWRVRPLVLIVKLWAHKHKINDAKYMTISSYSLVLMVIHFLQCGVSPPVLPCLQAMYPDKFNADSDVDKIDIHEQLRDSFVSSNDQTIGELLHDFLAYYVNFKYSEFAISVRLASQIPIEDCRQAQTYKNDPHQWKNLCIEEPFDLTNTAHSVYDPEVFEEVKSVFSASLNNLRTNYCLDSILYPLNGCCRLYPE